MDLRPKGLLTRTGNVITGTTAKEVVDVVGRYKVTIAGKTYDTVCVMDIECFNDAVASEQFVDQNGRTVLWRRFNRDDWAIDRSNNQFLAFAELESSTSSSLTVFFTFNHTRVTCKITVRFK